MITRDDIPFGRVCDERDNLLTVKDNEGGWVEFTYDDEFRVLTHKTSGGLWYEYTYVLNARIFKNKTAGTRNLIKLRDGLAALPKDYEHFDMDHYYVGAHYVQRQRMPQQAGQPPASCGAVACVLGHATSIVEPAKGDKDWDSYGERVFGLRFCDIEWEWLFSSEWSEYDNSLEGAVFRIDYYLKHGVPDMFVECGFLVASDPYQPKEG